MSLKRNPGIVGYEGSVNYIPFPPTRINPLTGNVYTLDEIDQIKQDALERRALHAELWGDYEYLFQRKYEFEEPSQKNAQAMNTYTRLKFPDLISIRNSIKKRMNAKDITKEQAMYEWDTKRARYMQDVVDFELSKRRFAREMQALYSTQTPASLYTEEPLYPFSTGESNPILKRKGGGSRRSRVQKKRRQTNRKHK